TAARAGHPISWGRFCTDSAPASVLVRAICLGTALLRYCGAHERIDDRRTTMLHHGLALAIAAFTFLHLLRGKWPRHVLTLAAGGLMVAVVLLGVMGSLDAVMEALSVDSFGKPQSWFAHGGVTERNVGINWSTVL